MMVLLMMMCRWAQKHVGGDYKSAAMVIRRMRNNSNIDLQLVCCGVDALKDAWFDDNVICETKVCVVIVWVSYQKQ